MIQGNKILRALLFSLLMLMLVSCNKGDTATAPYGSLIVVQPDVFAVADGTGSITWHDTYFTITVLDNSGLPMNNIELFIDFLWSPPDGYPYVQLYNGDTAVEAPMKVYTDESGTYHLRVDFASGQGLAYEGDIQIVSASAEQSRVSFSVTDS